MRYAIAPYRELQNPLPDEAALVRALGARIVLGRHVGTARLQQLTETNDAVVLAVGMGKDTRFHVMGDDLDGVLDSLPFIEGIKTESCRGSADAWS